MTKGGGMCTLHFIKPEWTFLLDLTNASVYSHIYSWSKSYDLLHECLMMQLKLEHFHINDTVPEFQCNFSSSLIGLTFFLCHIKCLSFQISCQVKKIHGL